MGYDSKQFEKEAQIKITYHGAAPTLVKLPDEAAKIEVKKGDTITVPGQLAKYLLGAYRFLWTFEGEEPPKEPKKPAAAEAKPIDKMNRKELEAEAKKRGIEVTEAMKVADIREAIAAAEAKPAATADDGEGDEGDEDDEDEE